MSATHTVVFAPTTQLQCRTLVSYIETNRPAIQARKTIEYIQSVSAVREIMCNWFSVNPAKLTKFCPWKHLGTDKMCAEIANTYSVPVWDIVYEANPAMN